MKIKTVRWLAVLWFAVTMTVAALAQDDGGPTGPPPEPNNGSESSPAQESNVAPESNAPPESNAARVSLINGDVSMQRGDTGEWNSATINTPLVRGDQLATGDRSRAEIQLDFANVLRLAAHSQAKIADLTKSRIQVQVSQGYANYSMFKGSEAEVEIDTPNVSVHPLRAGRYRVQVISDSETDVIVRSGEVQVTTPQGSTTVKEGELISIRGVDNPEYKVAEAPERDDWDSWNRDRDGTIKDADAWRRTNRYYTGAHDLDSYGRWVYVPGYGDVWQPDAGPDWAPYREGRWVWEPYWGWTWVSYEPWGWAPYHYGRWFYWNTGWVWWPGPVYPYYRPLWSPAFVFFFGFGSHVGFGFGNIGWCPVGPFDPFFPWWGFGFNRVHVVNITNINIINVNNFNGRFIGPLGIRGRQPVFSNASMILTNAHVRAGVTSVASADFGKGIHSSRRFGVDPVQLRGAHVMTANVPVVPTHESLQPGRAGARTGISSVQPKPAGRFFTRNTPPSGPPAFHEQASRMQHVVEQAGRTGAFSPATVRSNSEISGRGGNIGASTRIGVAERGGSQPTNTGGNRSIKGEGNARVNSTEDRSGWRSFGGEGHQTTSPTSGSVQAGPRSVEPMRPNSVMDRPSTARSNMERNDRTGAPVQAGPRSIEPMRQMDRPSTDRSNTERNDRPGWTKFSPPDRGSSEGPSGRQQLQMEKPIVTPRSSEGNSGPRNTMPSNDRQEIHNEHHEPSGSTPSRSPDTRSPHDFGGRGSGSYSGNSSGPYSARGSGSYGGNSSGPYSARGSGSYGGNSSGPYSGRSSGSDGGYSSAPYGGRSSGSYGGYSSAPYGGGHSSGSYGSGGHSSGSYGGGGHSYSGGGGGGGGHSSSGGGHSSGGSSRSSSGSGKSR